MVILSNKEKELLKFIGLSNLRTEVSTLVLVTTPKMVTVQVIEEQLSKFHVGALGRLLDSGLIEAKKDRQHSSKLIKHYVIKEQALTEEEGER